MQASIDQPVDGLFARAQSGDEGAWDELFRKCYPKVVRVVRRRLNQPMRSLYDSSDFASDVWRSLLAKSDRFDFPSIHALMAFLEQAAKQKVIDEHRKLSSQKRDINRVRSLHTSGRDGAETMIPVASNEPTASKFAMAREGWLRANDGLDESDRRALEMKSLGYSAGEIAEALGWDLRKVQRNLKKIGDAWDSDSGGQR